MKYIYGMIVFIGCAFCITDILGYIALSNCLKYLSIFGCLLLSVFSENNKEKPFRVAAMASTFFADAFLLFSGDYVVGIALFFIAHCFRIYYFSKFSLRANVKIAYGFSAFLFIAVIISGLSFLYAAAAAYAVVEITALLLSRHHRNYMLGMLLLLACDICVAISFLSAIDLYFLMWLFYLPSQILLAP